MALTEYITLKLDEAGLSQLAKDMAGAASMGVDAMDKEFKRKSADLRADLASGLISEQEFAAKGKRAAEAYNREILAKMDELRRAGKGASDEYAALGDKLKTVAKTGEQSAGIMSRAWGGFKNVMTGLVAPLAAIFSVKAVVDFATASTKGAIEQQHAWNALGQSIKANGENFADLLPKAKAALGAMGDKYLFDPDDLAAGMAKVNLATGDTAKSLKIMDASAALARKTGMDLASATDLVTQAVVNNRTRGLEKWVGPLDKSKDLFSQLNKNMGDVMANMTPMEQAQARMALAWDDLQDTLGGAILKLIDASGILPAIQEGVKGLTEWLSENQDEILDWGATTIRVIKIGVLPVWGALEAAFHTVIATWDLLVAAFYGSMTVWDTLKIGVLDLVATVDKAMIALDETLEKGLRMVGATELADQVHTSIVEMQTDYTNLKATVGESLAAQAEHNRRAEEAGKHAASELNKANAALTKGFNDAGDAVHAWATETTTSTKTATTTVTQGATVQTTAVETAGGKMTKAQVEAAKKSAAAWDKMVKDFKGAMDKQVADAKWATDQIAAIVAQGAKDRETAADKANDAVVKSFTDSLKQQSEAQRTANIERIREQMAVQQRILDDTESTTDQRRAAFERLAQLQQDLDAETTAQQIENADRYAKSREGAADRIKQAEIEAGQVTADANDDAAAGGKKAADDTEKAWMKSLDLITGAVQGLGAIFGDVFGDVSKVIGVATQGVHTFDAAFQTFSDKTLKGLDGVLKKLGAIGAAAGAGAAIGGALTGGSTGGKIGGAAGGAIGTAIGGPVGGIIGSAIGGVIGGFFKGSKDPGRLAGNEDAYAKALQGDAGALEFLKQHSMTQVGGGGQWATNAAKMDATEKWISALRKGAINHDVAALAELRLISKRLASAGFVEYKGWADALIAAIPKGIPGFQMGGLVGATGVALVHRGELVIPESLTQQLLALGGRSGMSSTSSTAYDNRSLVVNQVFNGVQDREIPRLAVEGIKTALTRDFKVATALEGNTRLPQ